ncbi:hypothetical protein [Alicyclobacillus sendaiensis]|uniref:hypothetical protein n=1 Tax=Alicyclobacillus sendaiensis TaxID=192387 RepID=UPI0026F456C9|nr:hypothetical protein [Alicyclobacillus sendaiensis]
MLTLVQIGLANGGHTYVFDNNGDEDCVILPLQVERVAESLWEQNNFPKEDAARWVAEQVILDNTPKQYASIIGKDARSIESHDPAWTYITQRALNRYRSSRFA